MDLLSDFKCLFSISRSFNIESSLLKDVPCIYFSGHDNSTTTVTLDCPQIEIPEVWLPTSIATKTVTISLEALTINRTNYTKKIMHIYIADIEICILPNYLIRHSIPLPFY